MVFFNLTKTKKLVYIIFFLLILISISNITISTNKPTSYKEYIEKLDPNEDYAHGGGCPMGHVLKHLEGEDNG